MISKEKRAAYMRSWRASRSSEQRRKEQTAVNEWKRVNRDKTTAAKKRYYAKDANRMRREVLRKYGMTVGDYEAMLTKQGGGCAICSGSTDRMCVDHCHSTGRVRGILRTPCNILLGAAKDNPNTLASAAGYLRTGWGK